MNYARAFKVIPLKAGRNQLFGITKNGPTHNRPPKKFYSK
jgi:hypothetical protein